MKERRCLLGISTSMAIWEVQVKEIKVYRLVAEDKLPPLDLKSQA